MNPPPPPITLEKIVNRKNSVFVLIITGVMIMIGIVFNSLQKDRIPDHPQPPSPPASISPDGHAPTTPSETGPGCKTGGCSGELCLDKSAEDVASICIYKDEYACYRYAVCEKQISGQCAWTPTSQFQSCLKNPSSYQ